MPWSDKYIDIPFLKHGRSMLGTDCWGLGWMVYKNELGIDIPSYDINYTDPLDKEEVAALIKGEKSKWLKVDKPIPFDIVILRIKNMACHIGIIVDREWMLHVLSFRVRSCLERYKENIWEKRIHGFFRYQQ